MNVNKQIAKKVLVAGMVGFLFVVRCAVAAETPVNAAKGQLVVQFKSEGANAVTKSAALLFQSGQSFSTATSDHSSSLDILNQHFGLSSVEPLLPLHHQKMANTGTQSTELFSQYVDEIKAKFPARSKRSVKTFQSSQLVNTYIFKLPKDTNLVEACAAYKLDPHVAYCQLNYGMKANAVSSPSNDPYFDSYGTWGQNAYDMWGLRKINVFSDTGESVWDITKGNGITVAVLDTGLDVNHPDIVQNLWINEGEIPNNGIDDDGNGFIDDITGWNFEDNTNNLTDHIGHGTFIAGIIAATGNNQTGIIGVAPQVKIMPIKFASFNANNNYVSSLVNAIMYAVDNGADILNISWNIDAQNAEVPALEQAIKFAYDMGLVIVTSAGNNNSDVALYSPANMHETITVGALGYNDERAQFPFGSTASNFGNLLDVSAPGKEILSLNDRAGVNFFATLFPDHIVGGDKEYIFLDGSSAAAAFASGVSALILSHNSAFTVEDVRQILRVSADDIGAAGFDTDTGYGRINALNAVKMTKPPSVRIDEPLHNATINIYSEFISIKGVAYGPNFKDYQLSYRPANQADGWIFFEGPITMPVSDASGNTLVSTNWDVRAMTPGDYILRLTVSTKNGLTFEDTVQLKFAFINNPPVFSSISQQYVRVGKELRFYVKATDPDGDTITYQALNLPEGATFSNILINGMNTGEFVWKPKGNQGGIYSVQFTATDKHGAVTTSDPVGIVVDKKNSSPQMAFVTNIFDRVIIWKGVDQQDGDNVLYSYRLDGGKWSQFNPVRIVALNNLLGLKSGSHTLEVKALDQDNEESGVLSVQFTVSTEKSDKQNAKTEADDRDKVNKKMQEMLGAVTTSERLW